MVGYSLNKSLSAAGITEDNGQGWKIVLKFNSWPRSKASRATVKFWDQSFSRGHYPLIYKETGKEFYLFYNPPNNFPRQTRVGRSCIFCGFVRVSLQVVVNQLFNVSVTGFCKTFLFLVFHDQLKVQLERFLVSWIFFRRNSVSSRTADTLW